MLLLEHPYRVWIPVAFPLTRPVALGSVIYAAEQRVVESLASLLSVLRTNPWVVPSAAVLPDEGCFVRQLIDSIPPLAGRVACVELRGRPPASMPVGHVVAAIHVRPRPTASLMAAYVASRLDAPALRDALEQQFGEALEGDAATADRSVATYCRLFQRYGTLTARDWRAIAQLAAHLAPRPRATEPSCPKWDRRARRYLGCPMRVASAFVGWEWVLEQALTRAKYRTLTGPGVLPVAQRPSSTSSTSWRSPGIVAR